MFFAEPVLEKEAMGLTRNLVVIKKQRVQALPILTLNSIEPNNLVYGIVVLLYSFEVLIE